MTKFKNLAFAGAAIAMTAVPVAAQAQQAGSMMASASQMRLASSFLCPIPGQDCVLPLPNAPAAAPAPVARPVTTAPVVEEASSFPLIPVLLGLAALGVGAYLLLDDDDDDVDLPFSP